MDTPSDKKNLFVKLRHGAQKYSCAITFDQTDKALVKISERDQGIAAGQYAVFYDGDECLGSGVIFYPALHCISRGDRDKDEGKRSEGVGD